MESQYLELTDPIPFRYTPGIFTRIFKRRENVNAVNGLNLTAIPGQILCLLGPNGSGKSTTMNCIAGNQKVTSGKIVLDPSGGIGYAPQNNVIWYIYHTIPIP